MFEGIGKAFSRAMKKVADAVFVNKKLINDIVKEIQKSLIEADVDLDLISEITDDIKKEALDEKIPGIEKKEILIKLIHDKLIEILGKEKFVLYIDRKKKPHKIMFVGLYGCGKTTTISKLAFYYSKRGYKVATIGLDVHRPAASEQLKQMSEKAKVACFTDKEKNVLKIWKKFEDELKKYDLVLIDTAGRDVLDSDLIKEINELNKEIKPDNVILVIPGDIGQTAKKQASEFKKSCNIDGVIVTRLDGTAKGGGALTSCYETKAKVYFIGVGEKISDIEEYNPLTFVSRILGMGDLNALLDKVRLAVDEKSQGKLKKRLEDGKFTLTDMCEQLKSMGGMGKLSNIANLIPGLGKVKLPSELLDVQGEKLKRWRFAIDSMTEEEKEYPEEILVKSEDATKRIQRISKGSHVPTNEIREMLKQYRMIKEFLNSGISGEEMAMDEKQLKKLAKKFGSKLGKGMRF